MKQIVKCWNRADRIKLYVYKKTDGAVAEKMNIIAVVTTNLGLFLLQILHLIHQLLTEHVCWRQILTHLELTLFNWKVLIIIYVNVNWDQMERYQFSI